MSEVPEEPSWFLTRAYQPLQHFGPLPHPTAQTGDKANPDRAGVGEGWASGILKTACGSLTHRVYQADESVFTSAFPSRWGHVGVPP